MKTYDPKKVTVIIGGFIIEGFQPGTFVNVARNSDSFTLSVGPDGKGTRSKSNDKSGRFTLTLAQSSESNAVLDAFANADEESNAGVVPALIKDLSGSSIHAGATCWVVKKPDSDYADEVVGREWVIETDVLEHLNAGN